MEKEYVPKLSPNDEQLVTDLAADYSERMVTGTTDVSIQEYLDKLPNEETRKAFKTLANMSRFMVAIADIEQEKAAESQDRNTRNVLIKPLTASPGI